MSGAQLGHLLLAVSVLLGAVGHTLLKHVVASVPAISDLVVPGHVFSFAVLGKVLSALLLLVISFGAWLGAIRHLDLAYAYAMASASIVVVAVLAVGLLGETVAPKAWLGLLLILAGCVLVSPAYTGAPR
jgi:drug/metabolite transporter (DMT)-like permease